MKRKSIFASVLALVVICVMATGCFFSQMTEQQVKGPIYTMTIKLPYEFKGEMKEQELQSNTNIYIDKFANCVDKPVGEDLNLVEFDVVDFDADGVKETFGDPSTDEGKQKLSNFGAQFVARYIASMTKAAKIDNPNMDSTETTVDGRRATVTTVDGKLKGEDERLKVIYIEDPDEAWMITLAYPKEREDGIGKKIDKDIIPNIKLTKNE